MTTQQKLEYFQNNYFSEWFKARQETENELSNHQDLMCICGKLATGLHESNCKKFRNKIISESIKKLEYLLNPNRE